MNAQEFNDELNKLLAKGFTEGVIQGKMTGAEMVGTIALHKSGLIHNLQMLAMRLAQQTEPKIFVPK